MLFPTPADVLKRDVMPHFDLRLCRCDPISTLIGVENERGIRILRTHAHRRLGFVVGGVVVVEANFLQHNCDADNNSRNNTVARRYFGSDRNVIAASEIDCVCEST